MAKVILTNEATASAGALVRIFLNIRISAPAIHHHNSYRLFLPIQLLCTQMVAC